MAGEIFGAEWEDGRRREMGECLMDEWMRGGRRDGGVCWRKGVLIGITCFEPCHERQRVTPMKHKNIFAAYSGRIIAKAPNAHNTKGPSKSEIQSSSWIKQTKSNGPRRFTTTRLQRLLSRLPPPNTTKANPHPPRDISLRNDAHA